MKTTTTSLLLLISLSIFCQNYQLTIEQGYGSGTYEKGSTYHVWSRTTDLSEVFTHWTGSGAEYLAQPEEWHTTINIPTGTTGEDFELIANYAFLPTVFVGSTQLPLWGEENESGSFFPLDKTIHLAVPQTPRAIIFLIHGTNGNSGSWYQRYERITLVKDLAYAGFATFALNSNETSLGDQDGNDKIQWENSILKQDTSTNIDFKNVVETHTQIVEEYDLGDIPVFMIGGSNGANFADYATAALGYKANAHMTGNGLTNFFNNWTDLKPIIWIQSQNDNNSSTDSTAALANFQKLIDQNVTTEWHWLKPSPVYPERFTRSSSIDLPTSEIIYQTLTDFDLLDDEGFLTIQNISTEFPFEDFYNEVTLNSNMQKDFEDQLFVCNADHIAHGDFNKAIIRFFSDCLLIDGVEEVSLLQYSDIQIYPNPAIDYVFIKTQNETIAKVSLFDLSGKRLDDFASSSDDLKIDLGTLTKGLYFLEIEFDGGFIFTEKIIIHR